MSDSDLLTFTTESPVNYTSEPTTYNTTPPSSTLPIDMVFNDGHRVVIIVNRWVRTKSFREPYWISIYLVFIFPNFLFYSILIVVSSIGNFTVLILLIRRRLKNPSRIDAMLMHLSIADLLVTFLIMPLEIGTNKNLLVISFSRMYDVSF